MQQQDASVHRVETKGSIEVPAHTHWMNDYRGQSQVQAMTTANGRPSEVLTQSASGPSGFKNSLNADQPGPSLSARTAAVRPSGNGASSDALPDTRLQAYMISSGLASSHFSTVTNGSSSNAAPTSSFPQIAIQPPVSLSTGYRTSIQTSGAGTIGIQTTIQSPLSVPNRYLTNQFSVSVPTGFQTTNQCPVSVPPGCQIANQYPVSIPMGYQTTNQSYVSAPTRYQNTNLSSASNSTRHQNIYQPFALISTGYQNTNQFSLPGPTEIQTTIQPPVSVPTGHQTAQQGFMQISVGQQTVGQNHLPMSTGAQSTKYGFDVNGTAHQQMIQSIPQQNSDPKQQIKQMDNTAQANGSANQPNGHQVVQSGCRSTMIRKVPRLQTIPEIPRQDVGTQTINENFGTQCIKQPQKQVDQIPAPGTLAHLELCLSKLSLGNGNKSQGQSKTTSDLRTTEASAPNQVPTPAVSPVRRLPPQRAPVRPTQSKLRPILKSSHHSPGVEILLRLRNSRGEMHEISFDFDLGRDSAQGVVDELVMAGLADSRDAAHLAANLARLVCSRQHHTVSIKKNERNLHSVTFQLDSLHPSSDYDLQGLVGYAQFSIVSKKGDSK